MIASHYLFKTTIVAVAVATLASCASGNINDCVVDGCIKYYDGCNDITCDVKGKEIATTSNYCKYSFYPWKAKCLICNKEKLGCADFICPDGCSTYYDGCNDITCDVVTGKMIDITDKDCGSTNLYTPNYKPSIYKPDEARCKKNFCPQSCKKWSDGCNKFTCRVNKKNSIINKNIAEDKITCSDEYTKNPKCIKYTNCNNDEGWTPAKMLWCCKKAKKENTKQEGCLCEGMSGKCNKEGLCTNGEICTTLGSFGRQDKTLDVCCPS